MSIDKFGGLFKGGVEPGKYEGVTPKHDVVKRGKETICWKDYIEQNNVDVEIYSTLKKYGTLKEEQFDYKAVAGDFDELNDLHETLAKQVKAKEMFEELPLETRALFNNDMNNFIDNGAEYCEKLIKADLAKAEETKKAQAEAEKQAKADNEKAHAEYIKNLKKELGLGE